MSRNQNIVERGTQVLIGNYARQPVAMERGEGTWVWDADGKRYLDLFAGFGGCVLGHCHPDLVAAATEQARRLWHVGNTFYTLPQIELGERLSRFAFPGKAFFCQSGAEANEAACKLARLRGSQKSPARFKIISLNKSFHGRTLAMVAATGNASVRQGFAPDVEGFVRVDPGDMNALKNAVDEHTAGILLEPIQGEGGVNLYPDGYIRGVRELCDKHELTLIFDEVWTGLGRTGRWFAHQYVIDNAGHAIEPDIMTLGKAVGGGLPVGVMWAKPAVADLLLPGKHGSTLGGNAICMAVSRTIFDVIERDKLIERAALLGEHGAARLRNDPSIRDRVADIRGRGLMLGIELKQPPSKLVEKGLQLGVLLNLTAQKVVRLAPPINITPEEWDRGLDLVTAAIASAGE